MLRDSRRRVLSHRGFLVRLWVKFDEISMPIELPHHIPLAMPAEREAKRGFSVPASSGYSKVPKPDNPARNTRVAGVRNAEKLIGLSRRISDLRESTPRVLVISAGSTVYLLVAILSGNCLAIPSDSMSA